MILTGLEIKKQVEIKRIKISPFNSNNLSTNSYDLHLDSMLIRYTSEILDPRYPPSYEEFTIPETGFVMQKGDFFLGCSKEVIGSDYYVPLIHARSGIARLGLFVHVTADLIDIGSHGQTTFQLYATLPVILYPNVSIAQVSFWVPEGEIELYDGKYQRSKGPIISKVHQDWTDHNDR